MTRKWLTKEILIGVPLWIIILLVAVAAYPYTIPAAFFFGIIEWRPRLWWAAGLLAFLSIVVISHATPQYAKMFYRYEPPSGCSVSRSC